MNFKSIQQFKPFPKLLILIGGLLLGLALYIIISCVFSLFGLDTSNKHSIVWMQIVYDLLIFFIPGCLFAKFVNGHPRRYMKVHLNLDNWTHAIYGGLIMVLIIPLVDWTTVWNEGWHWGGAFFSFEQQMRENALRSREFMESFLACGGVSTLIVNLIIFALIPAVCEETFFRGALQNNLKDWFGNPHTAIIVTAIIFSAFHGDLFGFVPRFLMGIFLGYLFYYSNSILVNTAAHFTNNAIVVLFYHLYATDLISYNPSTTLQINPFLTICCSLAALALFHVYFPAPRKHTQRCDSKQLTTEEEP